MRDCFKHSDPEFSSVSMNRYSRMRHHVSQVHRNTQLKTHIYNVEKKNVHLILSLPIYLTFAILSARLDQKWYIVAMLFDSPNPVFQHLRDVEIAYVVTEGLFSTIQLLSCRHNVVFIIYRYFLVQIISSLLSN